MRNVSKTAIAGLLLTGLLLQSCSDRTKQNKQNVTDPADSVQHHEGYTTPASYPGYRMVWHDEFNENTLDTTAWSYQIGTGAHGWGNNELEYYTDRPENLYFSSGKLIVEARKEDFKGSAYTSARIATKNKKMFTYGRIDIRAKLPVGQGIWPALWMLGNNISEVGWPQSGEIDIMELIGNHPRKVYGTLHWKKENGEHAYRTKSDSLTAGDFSNAFHVFSLIWKPDSIELLLDDHAFYRQALHDLSAESQPFKKSFYLVFNVAVGGDWPGSPDENTSFPKKMYVDYVRVFQKSVEDEDE